MAAKDDLFQLIKSLEKNEKRYFTMYTSRNFSDGESNTLLLFNELDRMEEYDEEKLKKKLSVSKAGKSLVKYLSAEKKALHTMLMRAMRNYHAEKSVDVQLHELLMDEQYYHGKSLYELQAKTLYKAKKLAEEYEKFPVLLTLLQREAKMLIERKTKDYDEVRSRVHTEESQVIEKLMNEYQFRVLKDDLFIDTRAGVDIRREDLQKKIDEKIAHPLMQSESNALSFHARIHYNKVYRAYYRLKSDMPKSWEHSRRIVELYEANSALKEELSIGYKIALANYLGACHVTHKYDEFEETLKKMKSIPPKSLDEEGEVFQDATLYELLYYLNTGKYSVALKAIPEIEKGMKLFEAKINKGSELVIYYNITVLYFILEDWKGAMHWVAKIIEDKSDSRKDLQHFARMLQLLFHYEMGKGDMMDYLTRSVYRYLEKEEKLMSFERMMILFLKKLPFTMGEKERLAAFIKLKEEIERLKTTPSEKTTVGMEEMTIWLTSKIEKRKMGELMKEIL
jgi:hypothetical protein